MRDGFSWTLSKSVASRLAKGVLNIFGARRNGTPGKVRQRTVAKQGVFAYINEREEQEIILLPAAKEENASGLRRAAIGSRRKALNRHTGEHSHN
jgi:hypothetical protein